jgi:hypothetical protein
MSLRPAVDDPIEGGIVRLVRCVLLVVALSALLASPAFAQGRCANGRSPMGAMWLSILHPGLGEYSLKGWGPWPNMPQKKFWLGWIPFYGWPGYLQVKSAIDASKCETNDDLTFK